MADRMRLTAISLPPDLYATILGLRKKEKYLSYSFSAIARHLLNLGLEVLQQQESLETTDKGEAQ